MESRKKRNQQIERKKRAERRIGTAIVVVIIAMITVGIAYAVWDTMNRSTVMTFNGERVPTSDFRYFHAMSGAEPQNEEMRQTAVDGMLRTLVVLDRAERHGLSISAEEKAEFEERAAGMRDTFTMMGINIRSTSDKRMVDFMSVGDLFEKEQMWPGPLFSLVMEHYVSDREPDQADLDEHLEGLRDDIIEAAREKNFRYIANESWDSLWDAWNEFNDEEAGFSELMRRYHEPQFDEFEEPIDNPLGLWDFVMQFEAWDHWQTINEMQEGEISMPMQFGELSFIVEMYESVVDEERVEEITLSVAEGFINEFREDAFFDLIEQWVSEANYQLNERALSRI
ncbi:MAG: hypothetical protein FWE27_03115 [Defluviitaleaceae bacterium]|nr:hypothetical protein [Defluviitaleaceae bacterium]